MPPGEVEGEPTSVPPGEVEGCQSLCDQLGPEEWAAFVPIGGVEGRACLTLSHHVEWKGESTFVPPGGVEG